MTAPNLTRAVATMSGLMVDAAGDPIIAVRIDRDPSAEGDDNFDLETGTWVRPTGDTAEVYSGPALVRIEDRQTISGAVLVGGQDQVVSLWEGRLPLGSPSPAPGDVVTITVSQRNADLVGRSAVVQTVPASGFQVSTKWSAIERVPIAFGRSDQP